MSNSFTEGDGARPPLDCSEDCSESQSTDGSTAGGGLVKTGLLSSIGDVLKTLLGVAGCAGSTTPKTLKGRVTSCAHFTDGDSAVFLRWRGPLDVTLPSGGWQKGRPALCVIDFEGAQVTVLNWLDDSSELPTCPTPRCTPSTSGDSTSTASTCGAER